MPTFSTKHKGRDKSFSIKSFHDGYSQEQNAAFLTQNQLSECKNLKYVIKKLTDGTSVVTLAKRPGTALISGTALSGAADVMACTYYEAESKYIIATATKLYYLDASSDPQEIGTSFLDGVPTFTEFNGKLIIHDSGITKYWDGTTADKIDKSIIDEVLGTGDNAETQFTGTFANIPITVSTITITFTDSTTKTITDDGAGALIGDVNGAGANTINMTTGVYDFTCSGAPDAATSVLVTYDQEDSAPKSKAGLVRASRLYTWGDDDNPSRLTYTEVNDEKATHSSSGGGYLDVDSDDGKSLLGGLNFETTLLLMKQGSLHRIDDYPDNDTFRVEKLTDDLGTVSHRTPLFEGDIVSFLSEDGWVAMHPSNRFGDIQKGVPLSKDFRTNAVKHSNSAGYASYNPTDRQLWLTLSTDGSNVFTDFIYVINLETGGQLSIYEFKFGHSCYAYANNKMLIGGKDGNLYELDETGYNYDDNAVDYSDDTFMRSAFTDWDLPDNWKHNKQCHVYITASSGATATFSIYTNNSYAAKSTTTITATSLWDDIFDYSTTEIYDFDRPIYQSELNNSLRKRFNYQRVMFGLDDIDADYGVEILGVDFKTAILGDK
jgi:hypothetical protein